MGRERTHEYRLPVRWTGNLGTGTSRYTGYSRNHEYAGAGKATVIAGSSDPAFRGDRERYNPEELLVGTLSSCHMLWYLHLCADAGIVVTEYEDDAVGQMVEFADGAGEFTRVTLHPRVRISDGGRCGEAVALHDRAREMCFLARSMRFPVEHEPTVLS